MNDLLQQAIADAKAIRDVAIENAKATLAESFEPQIKSMIKARLMESETVDADEEEIMPEGMYGDHEEEDTNESINLDSIVEELEMELGNNFDSMVDEMNHGEEDEDEELAEDVAVLEGILDELAEEDMDSEDAPGEQELEEILEAMEQELSTTLENEDEQVREDIQMLHSMLHSLNEGDDSEEDVEIEDDEESAMPSFDQLTPDMVDDMSKGELKDLVMSMLNQGASGEEDMDMDMDMDMGEDEEMPSEEEVKEAVEAVLDEMHPRDVRALEEAILGPARPSLSTPPPTQPTPRRSMNESREVHNLRKKLHESYQAVAKLQNTLNEVSLVNSKLLYTGKLFRAYNNLSEQQKVTILEYFDRVSTLDEVKGLYNKFTRALSKTAPKPVNESKTLSPNRLTESNASRSAGNSTKSTKILQDDKMISRWQELAGIVKQ